ncbi:hypothetical protein K443DRAFT_124464 [Laccaria amethystina LaAM-08-1]|uniref:Uncharacterized protein n=1 Tax=Laccaria amethystina LaAM-08-1 TaxID=1095629 RepID=A0A0C9X547_9AGAR|nr:hypothetical protein K443DRAFT_124464 [Laccaria amethystina LaAM-08-1]
MCTVACISLLLLRGPWEIAMSLSTSLSPMQTVNATLEVTADKSFLEAIKSSYANNTWCKALPSATISWPGLVFHDGLWWIGDWLIILRAGNLRETLFALAHDVLGHFRFDKTYSSLRNTGPICSGTLNKVMFLHVQTVNTISCLQLNHMAHYIPSQYLTNVVTLSQSTSLAHFLKMTAKIV